jgi:hydroxymethylbilane synthase
MPPAPAQGALAVQARRDDRMTCELLARIDRPPVRLAVDVERAVLEGAGGGCRAPLGALAEVHGARVALIAGAVDPDGSHQRVIELELAADADAARRAALDTGRRLREVTLIHEGGR